MEKILAKATPTTKKKNMTESQKIVFRGNQNRVDFVDVFSAMEINSA